MQNILKVKDLTKKFGKLTAVDQLSFTIKKGYVYGLLGPNGSGKSTTLGMILNVVNKTSGTFEWFDGNLSTAQALKKIGAIIEHPNFYPYMSAWQNLSLVCEIKEISTQAIDSKLDLVGLLDRKHDKFKTYSLGMKQRLAIASALLNDPEMLILDEPTNGLDPQGIHEIRQIIKDISATGTTIILASHLLDEVEKVCDQVIILQKGHKIFEGAVQNFQWERQWYEIEVENSDKVIELLQNSKHIKSLRQASNHIKVFPSNQDFTGQDLNRFLVANGIYIESLVKKQPRLEDEFLKITKN